MTGLSVLLFNETDGEDMASIKEIANACNVSPTAVSRILSHDPSLSVSTAVRTRVEDEARRVGYRTPRQKRSERTFTISLALSPFDKPGFEERLVGKYREIAGSGYEIQLYNPNRKSDGIIAIGEFSRDEVKDLESTCGTGNPGAGRCFDHRGQFLLRTESGNGTSGHFRCARQHAAFHFRHRNSSGSDRRKRASMHRISGCSPDELGDNSRQT